MYFEALRDTVTGLEVPGNCDALRELLPIVDLLIAKACPAIEEVDRSGEWEVEGAVSMVSWLRGNVARTAGAAKSLTTMAARLAARGRSAILDYGRSARTAPVDLFNALVLRDGGCREPGCDRPPAWCDAHHLVMWDDDGETKVDNLALRCSRHHHQMHRRRKLGWTERLEPDGRLVITAPDHRVYTSTPYGVLARQQLLAV